MLGSDAHKRFVTTFLLVFLGGLASAVLTILLVDPSNLLGRNRVGLYEVNERVSKPGLVMRQQWDALLIGSSKVAVIPPSQIPDLRIFNAAFGAAVPEEMAAFLNRFARSGQTIFIGFDLFMFNEASFPIVEQKSFAEPTWADLAGYVANSTTLAAAFKAVRLAVSGEVPRIQPDGWRTQSYIGDAGATQINANVVLDGLRNRNYRAFRFSERRMQIIREMIASLRKKGIEIVAFINPLQQNVRALIDELAATQHERFRRELSAIFPHLCDLTDAKPEASSYYAGDPYHYVPSVGASIISALAQKRCPRLGGA